MEQFDRVKRYLTKVQDNTGVEQQHYRDDVYSFFMHCWNLKDWIKSDRHIPRHVRKNVWAEVQADEN